MRRPLYWPLLLCLACTGELKDRTTDVEVTAAGQGEQLNSLQARVDELTTALADLRADHDELLAAVATNSNTLVEHAADIDGSGAAIAQNGVAIAEQGAQITANNQGVTANAAAATTLRTDVDQNTLGIASNGEAIVATAADAAALAHAVDGNRVLIDANTLSASAADDAIVALGVSVASNAAAVAGNADAIAANVATLALDPVIRADQTLAVPADYASPALAVAALVGARILPTATVTIAIADGTYLLDDPLILDHPDGDRIVLVGNDADASLVTLNYGGASAALILPAGRRLGRLQGVTLSGAGAGTGLTVASGGGALLAAPLTVSGFATGIELNGAHVHLEGAILEGNTGSGLVARGAASVTGFGTIRNNGSAGGHGLMATGPVHIVLQGGATLVSGNTGHGLLVELGASALLTGVDLRGNTLDDAVARYGGLIQLLQSNWDQLQPAAVTQGTGYDAETLVIADE